MKISLIIPCFNEEANLQKGVLDKIGHYTQSDSRFIEVFISDDGSTDRTKKIITEKYLKRFPKFQLLENAHRGKAFTIISAIIKAKGQWVLFSDMDLATPIEEAEKLIDESKRGFQIVIGSRENKREGAPLLRKIMAMGSILVRNGLIGIKGIKDTQCGFKLFNRQNALEIIKNLQVFNNARTAIGPSVSAAFDVEFLFIATKLKYRIKEVPVQWRHVETRNVEFFKDIYESLIDLLAIKFAELKGKYKF